MDFANNTEDMSRADSTAFWSRPDMIEPVELPALPPITPTSKLCVATIATGERGRQMLEISRPSLQQYAERVGADYHELTSDRPAIPVYPVWDKFRVEKLFDFYDRIVYIDADVIVRPTAPDLFALVPDTHVGKHDDLQFMSAGFAWFYAEVEELCRSQGYTLPIIPPWMLNSGVWIASRRHRDCFKPMTKPFNARHCAEQHHISIKLWESKTPIFLMDSDLHWQWYRDKALKTYPKGQFVHFAGLTDHKKRLSLMTITAAAAKEPQMVKNITKRPIPESSVMAVQPDKKGCGCAQKGQRMTTSARGH